MTHRPLLALAGCVLLLAVGCSSKSVREGEKVTGKVTFNGTPVANAKVIFTDGTTSGAAASGPTAITDDDGQYVLVGVKPGTYKVVVYKMTPKPGAKLPPEGEGLDLEQMEASGLGVHALPKKYSTPGTTSLTAAISSGANKVDLALEGKVAN